MSGGAMRDARAEYAQIEGDTQRAVLRLGATAREDQLADLRIVERGVEHLHDRIANLREIVEAWEPLIERLTAERDGAKEYADGASNTIRLATEANDALRARLAAAEADATRARAARLLATGRAETAEARLAAAETRVAVLEGALRGVLDLKADQRTCYDDSHDLKCGCVQSAWRAARAALAQVEGTGRGE